MRVEWLGGGTYRLRGGVRRERQEAKKVGTRWEGWSELRTPVLLSSSSSPFLVLFSCREVVATHGDGVERICGLLDYATL